jgi:FkbM family methyltransferase
MKAIIKNVLSFFGYSISKNNVLQKYKDKIDPYKIQRDLIGNKEDLCIFDVGAHYGETTIRYKGVFPDARIYSFEPFIEAADKFLHNTTTYHSISLFKHGFSNEIGVSKFYVNASDATNSLLNSTLINSWVDNATKNNGTINIKIDTIDNFCEQNSINKIDILKLDVQGGEMLALEGAIQMLSSKKINLIFMEVEYIEIYKSQPLFHDMTAFLAKYGYRLFGIYDTQWLENGQIAWSDAIFLKAD